MPKKKLLVLSQYYYPEFASTAQIYTDLCEGFADSFDVTVICAVPCYSGRIDPQYRSRRRYLEEYNGVRVVRVRVAPFDKRDKLNRVRHIVGFFFGSIGAVLSQPRPDVILTLSQPPILGGLLGVVGKMLKRCKLIYNIQDFNPEQAMAVKYSRNRPLLRLLMALDKWSCKRSDLVIIVGQDMQKTLFHRFRGTNVPRNTVINNWIDENEIYPLPKDDRGVAAFRERYGLDDKFVIMYSGNIGLYYDLENLIHVIGLYRDLPDVAFAFVGEGAMAARLESYVMKQGIKNVIFIPYQDKDQLIYSLNAADAHLVTNAKGIKGVSVPSKIYGVMATNIPVLGVLEPESEAWRIIEDSGCGVLCEAGDYEAFEKNLSGILDQRERFVKEHETGREYMLGRFTKERSIALYTQAVGLIAEGEPWPESITQFLN